MKAVVIGAGIGGLTAGIALGRAGWQVEVLEQARELEPVGSGLVLASNALRALDILGLGDRVRRLSRLEGRAGLRRPDGRWLTHTTEDRVQELYGDSIVVLLRATLVDLLADALGADRLRLGTAVTGVDAARGVVRTGSGELTADLVVAADGIHSPVRTALFPGHPGPSYAGVTAWRGLVRRPDLPIRSSESWGRGTVFGIHALDDDLVYYYATDRSPAGAVHLDERAELLRRFGDWHDPIPAVLEAADAGRILRNDLYYLRTPLPAMHVGRVALLGDAAHPMTPNLGQGAGQAIEDAMVLGHLADGDLSAYTAARLERTAEVVRRSMQVCRITALRNPVAVAVRDQALSLATRLRPDLMLRSMDEILRWRPPTR
ncbi:FAD-dependent monooxygenase [Occultella kanbiaonis]|uniref:FAD-dependent monooxygenase n=1 Tax=Occultella kanbiaonis TaxID=2675754 RepID=UPI0013D401D7|nr:FAD-dependent monooxygenase [Occultella kanbiaonis]